MSCLVLSRTNSRLSTAGFNFQADWSTFGSCTFQQSAVNDNLIGLFRQKPDLFPFSRPIDLERFLIDHFDDPSILPLPSKLFYVDETEPRGYGYPVMKSATLDDLETRLRKWLDEEVAQRTDPSIPKKRVDDAFRAYSGYALKLARNALQSSTLSDYHTVFWLVHSQQVARVFGGFPRRVLSQSVPLNREQADTLKYILFQKWTQGVRALIPGIVTESSLAPGREYAGMQLLRLLTENQLISTEEFISHDLSELRTYFAGSAHRDFGTFKKWVEETRAQITNLFESDPLFRRAIELAGYPDVSSPLVMLDSRVRQLIKTRVAQPPTDQQFMDALCMRLLQYFIVQHLRRTILWMDVNADGENVAQVGGEAVTYSRAIRPLDFGKRGIVEPVIYRFGIVYDITAFTQTLGEMAHGGEEETSYLQMLEFQRDLAEVAKRHQLQFEKFLGDGAFYTTRRALRTVNAAVEFQQFYSTMRAKGFAFNKGMRVAINYGYYRLLPMQISTDGTEIKEFYGPGIVELSRLTTGKATKIIEDVQHLLVATGYEQMDVYRFFAPLSRSVDTSEDVMQQREFYAYVNANGNLINEGIVASIPFLKELSEELAEDGQKLYRLRAKWAGYTGFPAAIAGAYIGIRLLGSVSLKGIGNVEVAEVARLTNDEAEISVIEDDRPLLSLLQQERNRSSARVASSASDQSASLADLVVCESLAHSDGPVILVGEWDPIAKEVRRPIQLAGGDAERYGLAVPLTLESVELQTVAYQRLYQKLSRIETLPSIPVTAIRENSNFSGFIIGQTVERL